MSTSRRLLNYARPYKGRLALAFGFSIGVSLLTTASAALVEPVLDDIFLEKDRDMLVLLPIAIIGIYVLKAACRYGHAYTIGYVGNHAVQAIRNQLYSHMVRMPLSFHSTNPTGTLISRVVSDVGAMQNAASVVVKEFFQNTVTLLALAAFVLSKDARFALIAFTVIPVAFIPAIKLGKRLKETSRKAQEEVSSLAQHVQDTMIGTKVVKSFGMEESETEGFRVKAEDHLRVSLKTVRLNELTSPILEVITSFGFAAIIWLGGVRVLDGAIKPGAFMAMLTAIGMMYTPIKALGRVNAMFQRALGAAERVFEVLDMPNETVADTGKRELGELRGGVMLSDVHFTYPHTTAAALNGVTIEVMPGEVVALLGRSGSGKSTVANLILRFYDPQSGGVSIDDVDLREFPLRDLRRKIGYVSQEVILFDGSIRSNILYGCEGKSEEEMIAAAKAAHAHEFICELDDGYDTRAGELGVRLSGGQRQRIAIARTLLANPPILILDEATSALDSESESLVHDAISRLMEGRTTVVIAHRLSTVRSADRIIVLDAGRVVEEGPPDQLMERDGAYRRLVSFDT